MPQSSKKQSLHLGDSVSALKFDALMEKASARDRGNIQRFIDGEHPPREVAVWKRMFCVMAALAPHATQTTGKIAVQFYVADGKHRLQVFALDDSDKTEGIELYIPDCLKQATSGGLLGKPAEDDEGVTTYPILEAKGESIVIEALDAAGTVNAPDYYKHMLGWNRKAIRVKLPPTATPAQVQAAEVLCMLGAALRVPEGAPVANKH